MHATATAKSLQSCPTLCDPIDGSPPGSAVPGILQARTREWVAISFSNAWKWKVKGNSLRCVQLWSTPWTAAHQAPPSMGFSRQEYWSGLPLPSLNECIGMSKSVRTLEASLKYRAVVFKLLQWCVLSCSVVSNSASPWTVVLQAPLSMEFSWQEYWSRLPFPTPSSVMKYL